VILFQYDEMHTRSSGPGKGDGAMDASNLLSQPSRAVNSNCIGWRPTLDEYESTLKATRRLPGRFKWPCLSRTNGSKDRSPSWRSGLKAR